MEGWWLAVSAVIGGVVGYAWARLQALARIKAGDVERQLLDDQLRNCQQAQHAAEQAREELQQQVADLRVSLATAQLQQEQERSKLEEQKQAFQTLRDQWYRDFENLANRIFEVTRNQITEQNRTQLESVFKPLQERISSFQEEVRKAYDMELRDKISLREEVRKLYDLSQRLSTDTENLSRALKGDTKVQGQWGEVVLERILEHSGLQADINYRLQQSTVNADGTTIRPDVIVCLPDNKHLIIDSKVSLLHYQQSVAALSDEERMAFLKQHVQSMRRHVKELSEKKYFTAEGILTPDFVLMFVPLEPAFMEAVRMDPRLFEEAWEKRIVIVSPSLLLASLRTVASVWKIENQNRNAKEIARLSGQLYDKLVLALQGLEKAGESFRKAQEQHEESMKRLYTGRNNAVDLAEKIKSLGASTTKELPPTYFGTDSDS